MIKTAMGDFGEGDMYKKSYPEKKPKIKRERKQSKIAGPAYAAAAVLTGMVVVDGNVAVANAFSSMISNNIFFLWH